MKRKSDSSHGNNTPDIAKRMRDAFAHIVSKSLAPEINIEHLRALVSQELNNGEQLEYNFEALHVFANTLLARDEYRGIYDAEARRRIVEHSIVYMLELAMRLRVQRVESEIERKRVSEEMEREKKLAAEIAAQHQSQLDKIKHLEQRLKTLKPASNVNSVASLKSVEWPKLSATPPKPAERKAAASKSDANMVDVAEPPANPKLGNKRAICAFNLALNRRPLSDYVAHVHALAHRAGYRRDRLRDGTEVVRYDRERGKDYVVDSGTCTRYWFLGTTSNDDEKFLGVDKNDHPFGFRTHFQTVDAITRETLHCWLVREHNSDACLFVYAIDAHSNRYLYQRSEKNSLHFNCLTQTQTKRVLRHAYQQVVDVKDDDAPGRLEITIADPIYDDLMTRLSRPHKPVYDVYGRPARARRD